MSFKRLQRALFRTMAAVVALAILFCIGLYGYRTMLGYTYDSSLSDEDLAASVTADENITNIALFGLDTREGDKQSHSDCMMIVTVDNTRGKIKLISLMRDSLVDIDGYGEDKLNAAYFRGGPSLAIRTINENFGTDIKDYVAVDFEQLVQIVDAIGGVDIDVQNDNELKELNRVIKDYGADIIRLWVASSDYTVDVRAGKNIFKQLSEAYRKIRNTARFILGNLDGFDPNTDCVADDQLQEIDRWALAALDDLIVNTSAGYAVYDFNKVYHAVYNFCVVAMSNFYLDVTKDRLYCTNGAARKAAQTTMYKILVALDKIIAPILCFTSQEIWDFMPKTEGMNKYVVFEDMPKAGQYAADEAFKAKWAQLIAVRDEVKKVLEQARAEKIIGASLEAAVTLYCNDAVYDLLNSIPMDELADLMIVSQVELVKGEGGAASAVEGLGVAAAHATGEKCERCWKYSATIGSHAAHPTLCARCASVVEA